eukprot:406819-Alexandrium_andersonii.AAC.1
MSASLVGSEMCIRDRDWASQAFFTRRGATPPSRGARSGRDATRARRSYCLLYTSDAADDM